MKIDRILYWFCDGDEMLPPLNEVFFGVGVLLNRLLNEFYDGKKLKFINLEFSTEKTYELHSNIPRDEPYYYGGHLTYYGLFNRVEFNTLNWTEKKRHVWDRTHQYLIKSAESMKNKKLIEAVDKAYSKGLDLGLNPDYRMVESDIIILGQELKVSVWVNFKEDGMYSKLTLEDRESILFEKHIDKTKNGVEFFLEMYKSVNLENDNIVIKGLRDVDYLPLKIPLQEIQI